MCVQCDVTYEGERRRDRCLIDEHFSYIWLPGIQEARIAGGIRKIERTESDAVCQEAGIDYLRQRHQHNGLGRMGNSPLPYTFIPILYVFILL